MDIKYQIFYATTANGPWTLVNDTLIDDNPSGNDFTITGLKPNTEYFVSVVGGVEEDGDFFPLITQPIGLNPAEAGNIQVVETTRYAVITSGTQGDADDSLDHEFTVTGIVT